MRSEGAAKSVMAAPGKRFWNSLRPIISETRQYSASDRSGSTAPGVPEHRKRILNTLDEDFLIEGVVVHILGHEPEMADAARHRVIDRVGEHIRGVRAVLDLPHQPGVNLGQFLRRLAARRDRLDGRRVDPHGVRHLVHELRQPVDGEARAVLRLALQADVVRPLVAREELQVDEGVLAVLAILHPRGFEALLRLLNDVNFGQGNLLCALRRQR